MRNNKNFILLLILIFPLFSVASEFRISMDNDVIADIDRHYTHGTLFSYSKDTKPYEHFLLKKDVMQKRWSFGQYMYTPYDIEIPDLIPEDRPYGGLIYFEMCEYIESKNRMRTLSNIMGLVGPYSCAEDVQKKIHKWVNTRTPRGWSNQLNNEIVLNMGYQDRYRIKHNRFFDLVANYGVAVGSIHTYVNCGSVVKYGWNVPLSYDFMRLEPLPRILVESSAFVFSSLEGRAVARNMFLDGNLFSNSHHVNKNVFVGDFSIGIGINLYNIDVLCSNTWRSKEFKGQDSSNRFGTISIAYQW